MLRPSLAENSVPTIAFIAQTTGNELWEAAHAGARKAALRDGFRIYWNAPTRSDDVERQIELIESAIRREDVGLVVAPTQYLALISPLRLAIARHIPVVVAGSSVPIPAGNGLVFVLNDDQVMGRMAARRVGMLLHGSGNVALLGNDPNSTGNWIRSRAFEETLVSEFPAVSIRERDSSSPTFEEAAENAEKILLRNSQLAAIVSLTSTDSEGALTALRLLHRTKDVYLIGCDQELDLMEGIREGQMDSVIAENSFMIGQRAEEAIAALRHRRSVQATVLIPPLLITRDNIDRPDIQQILSTDWRGAP
ncbi:MAG TPA: substrate-binding domain-containing protein [Acidobacteriaceae bacterium]|nr:substrate-binding domain-containing protein [Acidobacteriaceae bacterium]